MSKNKHDQAVIPDDWPDGFSGSVGGVQVNDDGFGVIIFSGLNFFDVVIIDRFQFLNFAFFQHLEVFRLQSLDQLAVLVRDVGINLHEVHVDADFVSPGFSGSARVAVEAPGEEWIAAGPSVCRSFAAAGC